MGGENQLVYEEYVYEEINKYPSILFSILAINMQTVSQFLSLYIWSSFIKSFNNAFLLATIFLHYGEYGAYPTSNLFFKEI